MRKNAGRAVLYPALGVGERAAAPLAQRVKRAKAEKAVKVSFVHSVMAGKALAAAILKKSIVSSVHSMPSVSFLPFYHINRLYKRATRTNMPYNYHYMLFSLLIYPILLTI